MKNKSLDLPSSCPLCGDEIEVTRIKCGGCDSEINSSFKPSGLAALPGEYQKFIIVFLKHRGNIRQVEKELGISYPTINKMLEGINNLLGIVDAGQDKLSRKEILDAIDKGQMSVRDATFILKNT